MLEFFIQFYLVLSMYSLHIIILLYLGVMYLKIITLGDYSCNFLTEKVIYSIFFWVLNLGILLVLSVIIFRSAID